MRITYRDVTPATVREHLRDVHGDEDWDSDVEPMSLHRLIHQDVVVPDSGEMGWQQGHLHPEYPLYLGEALWAVPSGRLARNACPLCGSRRMEQHHDCDTFVACGGCGETLRPTELVRFASSRTRRRYNAANGHLPDYR